MGGANTICSDKTGTLTKNKMTWTQIWAGKDAKIYNPDGKEKLITSGFCSSDKTMKLIAEAVSCNCIGTHTDAQETELAMLKFITRCGIDYEDLRKKYLPKEL